MEWGGYGLKKIISYKLLSFNTKKKRRENIETESDREKLGLV